MKNLKNFGIENHKFGIDRILSLYVFYIGIGLFEGCIAVGQVNVHTFHIINVQIT